MSRGTTDLLTLLFGPAKEVLENLISTTDFFEHVTNISARGRSYITYKGKNFVVSKNLKELLKSLQVYEILLSEKIYGTGFTVGQSRPSINGLFGNIDGEFQFNRYVSYSTLLVSKTDSYFTSVTELRSKDRIIQKDLRGEEMRILSSDYETFKKDVDELRTPSREFSVLGLPIKLKYSGRFAFLELDFTRDEEERVVNVDEKIVMVTFENRSKGFFDGVKEITRGILGVASDFPSSKDFVLDPVLDVHIKIYLYVKEYLYQLLELSHIVNSLEKYHKVRTTKDFDKKPVEPEMNKYLETIEKIRLILERIEVLKKRIAISTKADKEITDGIEEVIKNIDYFSYASPLAETVRAPTFHRGWEMGRDASQPGVDEGLLAMSRGTTPSYAWGKRALPVAIKTVTRGRDFRAGIESSIPKLFQRGNRMVVDFTTQDIEMPLKTRPSFSKVYLPFKNDDGSFVLVSAIYSTDGEIRDMPTNELEEAYDNLKGSPVIVMDNSGMLFNAQELVEKLSDMVDKLLLPILHASIGGKEISYKPDMIGLEDGDVLNNNIPITSELRYFGLAKRRDSDKRLTFAYIIKAGEFYIPAGKDMEYYKFNHLGKPMSDGDASVIRENIMGVSVNVNNEKTFGDFKTYLGYYYSNFSSKKLGTIADLKEALYSDYVFGMVHEIFYNIAEEALSYTGDLIDFIKEARGGAPTFGLSTELADTLPTLSDLWENASYGNSGIYDEKGRFDRVYEAGLRILDSFRDYWYGLTIEDFGEAASEAAQLARRERFADLLKTPGMAIYSAGSSDELSSDLEGELRISDRPNRVVATTLPPPPPANVDVATRFRDTEARRARSELLNLVNDGALESKTGSQAPQREPSDIMGNYFLPSAPRRMQEESGILRIGPDVVPEMTRTLEDYYRPTSASSSRRGRSRSRSRSRSPVSRGSRRSSRRGRSRSRSRSRSPESRGSRRSSRRGRSRSRSRSPSPRLRPSGYTGFGQPPPRRFTYGSPSPRNDGEIYDKRGLNAMLKDDVVKIAEDMGLEVNPRDTKAKLINKILRKQRGGGVTHIVNPISGERLDIRTKEGIEILKNYISEF